MNKFYIILTEKFSPPIDEGFKGIIYNFSLAVKALKDACFFSSNEHPLMDSKASKLNRLLINRSLFNLIRSSNAAVLYIPEASYTTFSFIRVAILKIFCKSKVFMIGLQKRNISNAVKLIPRHLRPEIVFVQPIGDAQRLSRDGFCSHIIRPGVDSQKYVPADSTKKMNLREKYGVPRDRKIVLHVGHINTRRNIKIFEEVQRSGEYQVLLVGSTSTKHDCKLLDFLKSKGIMVIHRYIKELEEIYQLSDLYVFPTVQDDAAVDLPLSILEAMACNLPVLTTRYGALYDYFKEDEFFRYFETPKELMTCLRSMKSDNVKNVEKICSFSWDSCAHAIIAACEGVK